MPLVQIKGVSGYLTLAQKQEIIRKVTDAVLSVEGEGLRPVTWVTIQDVAEGAWGVGGTPVTAEHLRQMVTQPPAR
ncbi:MAG: 4-oxalocrotonate tautomerase family protein [Hyphomicrobiaceae bacterium]